MQDTDDPRFRPAPGPRKPPARRAQRRPSPPPAAEEAGERLQKVLADAGVASRRDCELAILAGRVRVNGRPVHALPCLVRPQDDLIEFDGEVIDTARRVQRAREAHLYFAANKPKGVISTVRDPEGRVNVVSLVAGRLPRGRRVYPVGRLDADSTGLVLLTDDGELAHRLAHPRHGIAKEYHVTAEGALEPAALDRLRRGIYLAGPEAIARSKAAGGGGGAKRAAVGNIRVVKSWKDRRTGGVSVLSIMLREGQNREIRRLLAHVGLKVRRLERVAIGPLRLGSLKSGAARPLTEAEVAALRGAVLLAAK
ncbi:MAG: rRNA pseudouridine synthase [Steroidobacteraceae bacterium]|jgi:pseudouridine synthase|nr:rRNA pseudouridine synthase [Steroidobacteraceae bacterium]